MIFDICSLISMVFAVVFVIKGDIERANMHLTISLLLDVTSFKYEIKEKLDK